LDGATERLGVVRDGCSRGASSRGIGRSAGTTSEAVSVPVGPPSVAAEAAIAAVVEGVEVISVIAVATTVTIPSSVGMARHSQELLSIGVGGASVRESVCNHGVQVLGVVEG
jgi:hypothetical protein